MTGERERLAALAFRSKAHWGYSQEFMEACRDELAVSDALLASGMVFVAEVGGEIAGFYALQPQSAPRIELSHCFVEPDSIGKGIGRALLEHAIAQARQRGGSVLVIQSDPQAAGFYAALGARSVGFLESDSIPGRMLPLLEVDLCPPADSDAAGGPRHR